MVTVLPDILPLRHQATKFIPHIPRLWRSS